MFLISLFLLRTFFVKGSFRDTASPVTIVISIVVVLLVVAATVVMIWIPNTEEREERERRMIVEKERVLVYVTSICWMDEE